MKTEEITDGDLTLAIIIRDADWKGGGNILSFVSSKEDYQQVGTWEYSKGQKLAPHIHSIQPRQVLRTQEVIFIKDGQVRADIYTEKKEFLKSVNLRKGDTIILLNGGHGYEILEDNTKVLEVKNGPYPGAERDRERI
ncbi:hypothetical protein MUP46_00880 [Patescibacteria group bacterium]|nr:hypothetical protein [Patescibacteria group bacterium]